MSQCQAASQDGIKRSKRRTVTLILAAVGVAVLTLSGLVDPASAATPSRGVTVGTGTATGMNTIPAQASPASDQLQHGVATRPAGSDRYWPPVGTRVAWTVTQPIQDLLDQGATAHIRNLGTIGNTQHLRQHGDHTPWSAGKVRGKIYAKDSQLPANFEAWLVAKCKSHYNTLWIDFFNINGKQYNNAGRYLRPSPDQHLHISVRKGYEDIHVTLFRDYASHR